MGKNPVRKKCKCGIWFYVTHWNKEKCTACKPPEEYDQYSKKNRGKK